MVGVGIIAEFNDVVGAVRRLFRATGSTLHTITKTEKIVRLNPDGHGGADRSFLSGVAGDV